MFVFESSMDLTKDGPFDVDEITDVIETLIETLDECEVEPDISTTRNPDGSVHFEIAMRVNSATQLQAQRAGLAALMKAMTRAEIELADFPLEPAVITSKAEKVPEPA